ncbi:hypothetical protein F7725_015739 [Dissostichus mawsoni]|uniref:[histone H4]-lysine(20) N-methyltransferase n=1 Tax=Dissostichus mawsoni TaxID=36200 RepID=A0A7J5YID7_DISMA|nr:hypothetical protein F7725_015739 [Dissostichus mawsoni]
MPRLPVSFILMEKDGGEELWRLHRLSCWQFKQQHTGSQSPWKGAGGKGGHCRVSRARLISDPAEKFIYILSSKRKRAERRELEKQVGHERVHNEIKLTQEGRSSPVCFPQNDARRLGEGRRTNSISATPKDSKTDFPEMESSYSQCSPCWLDEHPPQLHCAQTCLRSPSELPLPLGNSLSHAPLHSNNNSGTLHGLQRRPVRLKGRKSTIRIASGKNSQNRKVTDYYPIRRSSRKSKTELQCEEKRHIDDLITKGIEEGMEVQHIEGKGRGVFATRCFQKSEYVVEYHGDLLQITDAKQREAEYALNPATGCYIVDATKESGRMGRLINHSKIGNCQTKLHEINGVPHLIFVASRDVDEGEELLYDYGDRSKASIAAHPWLKY